MRYQIGPNEVYGIYTGEVNEYRKPHGWGRFKYSDGKEKYVGSFRNGNFDGLVKIRK